jgi:toxin YoeB
MRLASRLPSFVPSAFADLAWWIEKDWAQALWIVRPVREIQREPYSGLGKPEPLKRELSGCGSKRINQEHRLVYRVQDDKMDSRAPGFSRS